MTTLELADIFHEYGEAYRQKYAGGLLPVHRQAMRAIENCRTEALGGQLYGCIPCQEFEYKYHSCRNRHCPKCQHELTQAWLEVQREMLLPVPYFMITFTLPSELRQLASRNQKVVYDLLFRASAEVTQKLAQDPHYVGGQIGLVGALHTWKRNMANHPHVHYLSPGGGLSADGQSWLPAHGDFFLPVLALSKMFRAAFQHGLQKTALYNQVPLIVWRKKWVVNCIPVGDGHSALKYLAPYIHRVAISNRRLISITRLGSMETSQVTFQYRPSDKGPFKLCTLSVESFIHRFLQHVLPHGFVKVRYFGFFGASVRSRLALLQQRLGKIADPEQADETAIAKQADETAIAEPRLKRLCPKCGQPMVFQRTLQPQPRTLQPLTCRSP
jgi:hypothetical protein